MSPELSYFFHSDEKVSRARKNLQTIRRDLQVDVSNNISMQVLTF